MGRRGDTDIIISRLVGILVMALEIAGVANAGENLLPDDARESRASIGCEDLGLL